MFEKKKFISKNKNFRKKNVRKIYSKDKKLCSQKIIFEKKIFSKRKIVFEKYI